VESMSPAGPAFDRRRFLVRSGFLGAAAALAQVPGLLQGRGWFDRAYALEPNIVRDTLNGLVAMVFPGNDEWSIAQGDATDRPGGVAADTTTVFIEALDAFVPAPDGPPPLTSDATVPISGAVANLLNVVALTVNPAARGGTLASPFSRLSIAEKAQVFRLLEEDSGLPGDADLPQPLTRASGNFAFVAGILPGFVAFLAYGEWQKYDPATKALTGRPVGWEHTGYQPGRTVPVEGWDELLGYYQDRTEVEG
jgi:hypothetical protein